MRKSLSKIYGITLILTLLFTLGVGQMWGYWYVPSTIYSEIEWNTNCTQMSSDNYLTYYCVPPGTYAFKLAVDKNSSITWGFGALTNGTTSIITDLTTGSGSGNNSITVNTTCNIVFHMTDGSADGTWACTVTAGSPTLPIKANFNNGGDWVWKTMQSNGDGTVSIKGLYGNISTYNFRRTSREVEASWDGQYVTSGVTAETGLSASDNAIFTYKASDGTVSVRKANTVTKTNYIYFDNEDAGWSDTYLYFAIGHPEYSKMYRIQQISNTQLWYNEQSSDSWSDVSYYAVAGGSGAWDGGTGWGMPSLMGWTHRSAPYTTKLNLESGYNYIVGKENGNNDEAISITKTGNAYSSLNSLTVGYKYVVDGSDMTSGGAPAQITMNSYVFNAHSTVTGNAAQTINANASGTYSKSNTAAYRGKVVLTQSNLSDGYKFIGWYNGNTQKETNDEYTYYPNENTTISAKYEYRWTLKGTFPDETEWAEDHYISNFSINASSEDVGYLDIDLPGNTSFQFKVVDRTNNTWHSCSGTSEGSEYNFTYLSDKEKDCSACTGSEKNMIFNTAAPGTYRFTWNADTKTLTVTYPASYKVTYDGNDKTSGTVPTDNDYYAANATVTVEGNGGSLTKTGYNTLAYWNTENDGSGTDIAISTGTFSITDNTTLYAKWTQGVTLHDNNGAAHNGSTTVNWNAAGPFSITAPTRDHYSVEGYYAEVGCTNKVLTAAGAIAASSVVDGSSVTYISSSKWKHAAATTLYAKWTEDEYTVTTSSGTGGSVDEDSYTAYVATTTAISATPETGYKFLSWEVVSGSVTFADQYSASTTMNATSYAEIKANFVYRWSIAGTWKIITPGEGDPYWDADTYAMGNITTEGGDDVCSIAISLDANTDYKFKVADRSTSPYTWYGISSSADDVSLTYTSGNGDDNEVTSADGNKNIYLKTAGAGNYTFKFNITDKTVSVTYPTSYTVTYGYNTGIDGEVTASGSVSGSISSGDYAVSGEDITFSQTTLTGFTFLGWFTTNGGTTAVTGMSTSDNVLDKIGANATVYAKYSENHFDVTAAASPATGGTVTPASATSFGQYYGGDISATPYIGYGFTGWTGGTGSYVDASLMSTKFKPTATSTVTAGFSRRYAFIEGNFQIYDQARSAQTKTGNEFVNNSTAIQMEWDDTNHWFYLHTYSTPAELAANLNNAAAWFYIMTSSANNALSNTCAYKSASGTNQDLSTKGKANKKTASYVQSQSFRFTGSDAGYVVLYFDGESVWYDLEYKVTYNGNSNTSGTAPALAYYAEGSTPAAETNDGDLARAGYVFRGWSTSSGVNQAVAYETGATMSAMSADVTLYAAWFVRYALYGSLDNTDPNNEEGMPGWSTAKNFTYDAENSKYTVTVDLTKPNTNYKFRVLDHIDNTSWGYTAENHFVAENTATTLSGNYDVKMATAGRGTYTLTVVEADEGTHPRVTITNPTSYIVTLGTKYVNADGSDAGDLGATITATDAAGNTYASGKYIASGETVTVTAGSIPTGYHFVGWWSSSDYSGDYFATANPTSWTVGATVNAYAKFAEDENTFSPTSGSNWSNTANWAGGVLPTINDVVYITAPVIVDVDHATAKRIILDQSSSNTGKLTVQANKGLEVAGTITRTTDGSNSLATREEDLVLESDAEDGNASLIFNNSNACQATVQMYSKASIDREKNEWKWQYVGTPFTGSIPLYNYYGSWMYKWYNGGWAPVHGNDVLDPFVGYCLTQESGTTHVMGGTLVATDGNNQSITMADSTNMVIANSWTAPIYIDAFTTEGEGATFTSEPATIYMFNTGMAEKGSKAGTTAAGTYVALPVHSATSFGVEFIPSMQGFFVTTKHAEGGKGTITLKYDELVRPDNEGYRTSIITGQMYAPKRENKPEVMKIRVDGETYYDRVVILAREDFSNAFDNGWDGENINEPGNGPMIYALREDGTKDAVSAIPSFEGTVVGFHPGTDNSCTISFEYNGEDVWYLNDLKEQKSTLIDAAQTYTFSTSSYDSATRFIISATPITKITTGIENDANDANDANDGMMKVRKLILNDKLFIIRGGRMYSVDGAMIK